MATSIKERTSAHAPDLTVQDVRALLEAALVDLAALRASIVGITAQLDADGGVTGTTFASANNPAALTLTA